MEAFEEGYEAYYAQKDETNNPYKEGTNSYRRWRAGWANAFDEDQNQRNPTVNED